MNQATEVMKSFNARAIIGESDGVASMIEDVMDDPIDRRWYRIEIQATPDGRHAIAFCRFNPWGGFNGGASYTAGHVASDGFICLGRGHDGRDVVESPYDVSFAIRRARYWCVAFSSFMETGRFPNPT